MTATVERGAGWVRQGVKDGVFREPFSGAGERASHPEGDGFARWWGDMMIAAGSSWARQVMIASKETLWEAWKRQAAADDERREHGEVSGV